MPSIQRGSSLIEVLVSLVLVAVTMLGLLGLQLRSMGMQKDSLDRRNAAILVASFADRIAGNFEGANAGVYSGGLSMGIGDDPPPKVTVACTDCNSTQIGQRDWDLLQIDVRNRLPQGVVDVRLGTGNAGIVVTVGWLDPQRESLDFSSGAVTEFDPGCAAVDFKDVRYRCYVASIFP